MKGYNDYLMMGFAREDWEIIYLALMENYIKYKEMGNLTEKGDCVYQNLIDVIKERIYRKPLESETGDDGQIVEGINEQLPDKACQEKEREQTEEFSIHPTLMRKEYSGSWRKTNRI